MHRHARRSIGAKDDAVGADFAFADNVLDGDRFGGGDQGGAEVDIGVGDGRIYGQPHPFTITHVIHDDCHIRMALGHIGNIGRGTAAEFRAGVDGGGNAQLFRQRHDRINTGRINAIAMAGGHQLHCASALVYTAFEIIQRQRPHCRINQDTRQNARLPFTNFQHVRVGLPRVRHYPANKENRGVDPRFVHRCQYASLAVRLVIER